MKTLIDPNQFGPWAIVTGASSGIGKEFAHQLAAHGLNLVLAARRHSLLNELGEDLKKRFGIQYTTIPVDLSKEDAYRKITNVTDDLNIGLLVSNAGTGRPGRFLASKLDDLMYIVRLNALSSINLTHHIGQQLIERGKGGIVLTGAMGAIDGLPFMAAASGTKAMIEAIGKALHTEFKDSGVNITVLVTSPTETPILTDLGFTKDNLPTKPISVIQCVEETLVALSKNNVTVVPGRKFRLMKSLVPASVNRKMMGGILKANNRIE